jgi:hypothetical protein
MSVSREMVDMLLDMAAAEKVKANAAEEKIRIALTLLCDYEETHTREWPCLQPVLLALRGESA